MTAPKLPPRLGNGLNDEINFATEAWLWLKTNLAYLTGAMSVLIIGVILARLLSRWADRALTGNSRIEPTVAKFLSNIIKYALWVIVAITVLTQFGVQTTSIIAALGGLALAVGLALQGTLSNVAAGVMILIQRPFRVGEYITAGPVAGTVQAIGLFTTEMLQLDGLYVMVPNNELWNKAVVNYSRLPTRRFELVVPINYEDDLRAARAAMLELATADPRVLAEPAPVAFVGALADNSVRVGLRVWCNSGDYLALSWALNEGVKLKFDELGLTIPTGVAPAAATPAR
ncbi:small conductance mechanosensitive channel [Erythromicrobium ramosum]|uniref:Small-conductance mechanosensitive channel n=1 Tax=Erythrobacter ramosus TaxID=35811 RepID=A0A6I4UIR5_9SPHN|nr:mechanosensitive ion channel domain-containing protein [Erythrobacter ramosus]MBB3774964.1 small conductance mechanosensitive channel [Erythrobacter ramosus]MXP37395.1 mechanosensitive ion channel [Erythrobacter ramosus]